MTIDLPVFRIDTEPALAHALRDAANRVIASNCYVLGSEVDAFEREFAALCGSSHCIGVANGTDAIELALRAAGVSQGDRVMTVANAGYYTTAALHAIGAVPVYVDVGQDMAMTVAGVGKALGEVKAVVVTHLYGRMAAVDEICAHARRANVVVIEDCAQAHGAIRGGKHAGTFGVLGCFSFYPTKNLGALGDAGAVITDDAMLEMRLRALRQYGWSTKYRVECAGGRNSRLDEMQAAFLRAKLPFLRGSNAARVAIACRYREGLRGLPVRVPEWRDGEYVAHLFTIRCDDRDALRAQLAMAGIGTDIHYPVPDYAQVIERGSSSVWLPLTEAVCREVLTLPCFPGMTNADVDRVISAIRGHYGQAARA